MVAASATAILVDINRSNFQPPPAAFNIRETRQNAGQPCSPTHY
jgi:hypothetical protein